MFKAMAPNRILPPALLNVAKTEINNVLMSVQGVNFIMLCSSDGFELAIAKKRPLNNEGKVAAVSSSILAMVSAFVSEIQLTGCQSITLEAENGKAILTSLPTKHHPMLMVSVADKDVLTGSLAFKLHKASEAIVLADEQLGSV